MNYQDTQKFSIFIPIKRDDTLSIIDWANMTLTELRQTFNEQPEMYSEILETESFCIIIFKNGLKIEEYLSNLLNPTYDFDCLIPPSYFRTCPQPEDRDNCQYKDNCDKLCFPIEMQENKLIVKYPMHPDPESEECRNCVLGECPDYCVYGIR